MVVLCDFNPVIGSEQAGIRPALVFQIDRANETSPHTVVAPFTTKISHSLRSSHYLVKAGQAGLVHDSVLLCEQVRAIDKIRMIKLLGVLDQIDITGAEQALRTILGL